MSKTVTFFIGWFMIIAIFYGLTLTEGGKRVVYYTLWLTILLIAVTRSNDILAYVSAAMPSTATTASPTEPGKTVNL